MPRHNKRHVAVSAKSELALNSSDMLKNFISSNAFNLSSDILYQTQAQIESAIKNNLILNRDTILDLVKKNTQSALAQCTHNPVQVVLLPSLQAIIVNKLISYLASKGADYHAHNHPLETLSKAQKTAVKAGEESAKSTFAWLSNMIKPNNWLNAIYYYHGNWGTYNKAKPPVEENNANKEPEAKKRTALPRASNMLLHYKATMTKSARKAKTKTRLKAKVLAS